MMNNVGFPQNIFSMLNGLKYCEEVIHDKKTDHHLISFSLPTGCGPVSPP